MTPAQETNPEEGEMWIAQEMTREVLQTAKMNQWKNKLKHEENSRPNMRILGTMIWWISGAMTESRGFADFRGGGGSRATNVRAKMFPSGGLFPKQGPLGRSRHEQPAEDSTPTSAN